MKVVWLSPIVAAFVTLQAPAAAQEVNGLNYNRAGIGYGSGTLSGVRDSVTLDGDASGVAMQLQTLVAEKFVLGFGYERYDGDIKARANSRTIRADFKNTNTYLTLGYRVALVEGTDLVPRLIFLNSDASVGGESADDSTTAYGLFLNTRLSERVQATIGFKTDGKDDEYGKTYDVGLLFKATPTIGLGMNYSLNDVDSGDTKTWTLMVEHLF